MALAIPFHQLTEREHLLLEVFLIDGGHASILDGSSYLGPPDSATDRRRAYPLRRRGKPS
jgi:hypothetical protein